ncbi:MAG: flagellar hook-associated protein FlgL [Actinomycetota bacterium]
MRVTNSMMMKSTLRDVGQNLARLQDTQNKLSSGKQIGRPSDDPSGTTSAMSIRRELRQFDRQSSSLVDAQGWVGTADAQLTSGLDQLVRAKDLVVRAGNGATQMTPSARAALATELRSVSSDLLSIANSNYAGRPVFAGTAAGVPYDLTGAYAGNDDAVVRDVDQNTSMTVNVTGSQVFGTFDATGTGTGNMFQVLDRLATAIQNGDNAAMATEHANLDAAADTMRAAAALVGSRSSSLEQLKSRLDDRKITLQSNLSQVEDVDVVEALVRAKAQETTYQASVQTAAKILPVSLLDYLH